MDGKTLARIGAIAFVALAIVATAIETTRHDALVADDAPTIARPLVEHDPLAMELARCSGIGEAGERDPSCLCAWAENRRRFLGQPVSAPSSASSAPTTLFPGASNAAEQAAPTPQPAPSEAR